MAGPREISINRSSAIPIIHGARSPCTKGPWYSQLSDDSSKINFVSLRNSEFHRQRRRAWDKGLGAKGEYILQEIFSFSKLSELTGKLDHSSLEIPAPSSKKSRRPHSTIEETPE